MNIILFLKQYLTNSIPADLYSRFLHREYWENLLRWSIAQLKVYPAIIPASIIGIAALGFLIETHTLWKITHNTKLSPIIVPSNQHLGEKTPAFLKDPLFGKPPYAIHGRRNPLSVQVIGVFYDRQSKRSHAILKYEGKEEQVYWLGESLSPGVELRRINKNGVYIQNQGVEEYYALPSEALPNRAIPGLTP
ncbi:MAG: type II secretion system protein N [Legionellaceae bacterium]|nr:type II secretion system protein N [Legionellaceae bacterium]